MAVTSITISEFNDITKYNSDKILNPQRDYLFINIQFTSQLNESTYTTTSTNINRIFNPVINYFTEGNVILWPYYIAYKLESSGTSNGFYHSTIARYTGSQYLIEFQGFNPSNNKISYLQICKISSISLKFYNFEYSPS